MIKKLLKIIIYCATSLTLIISTLLPTITVSAADNSILIIGDSITQRSKEKIKNRYGGCSDWDTHQENGHAHIEAKCGNLTLNATDGRTFQEGFDIYKQKYQGQTFNTIIIELGSNNYDGHSPLSENTVKDFINAIDKNTRVYLVTNYDGNRGDYYNQNNNKFFRNIVKSNTNVGLIDWASQVINSNYLEGDDLHPNNDGQNLLARLYTQVAPYAANSNNRVTNTSNNIDSSTLATFNANKIKFYNPSGSNCVTGGYAGTISGDSNEAKIWNYFVSAGINGLSNNPAAIAGIMGNIQAESSFNPFASNGSHRGLYQTNATPMIAAINSHGYESYWGTTNAPAEANDQAISIELDYLINDTFMPNDDRFKTYLNNINNSIPNSAEGAEIYAELFLVAVERATGGSQPLTASAAINLANSKNITTTHWQNVQGRRSNAAEIYNKYASSTPTEMTSTTLCGTKNTIYTGEGIPQYLQCDSQWGGLMYGSGGIHGSQGTSICDSGCGPTSFAMMATTLLNQNILPSDTADIAGRLGQHVPDSGSSWTITETLAKRYGLQYQAINSCNIDTINQYLNDGWMIHTSGRGSVPFSSGGHYIGITSIQNGQWYIADSARGNKYYSPSTVVNAGMACSNVRAIKR